MTTFYISAGIHEIFLGKDGGMEMGILLDAFYQICYGFSLSSAINPLLILY